MGHVLTNGDGRNYFLLVRLARHEGRPAEHYIAPMKNPLTISGSRVLIATPDHRGKRKA